MIQYDICLWNMSILLIKCSIQIQMYKSKNNCCVKLEKSFYYTSILYIIHIFIFRSRFFIMFPMSIIIDYNIEKLMYRNCNRLILWTFCYLSLNLSEVFQLILMLRKQSSKYFFLFSKFHLFFLFSFIFFLFNY